MRTLLHRRLLVAGLGLVLAGMSCLLLFEPGASGRGAWSSEAVLEAVLNPRRAYCIWRIDRETKAVKRLIREADICLDTGGGRFIRTKPLGADGHPVKVSDVSVAAIVPEGTSSRGLAVLRIPSIWPAAPGSNNPSGTDAEDFALDIAMRVKALGFQRITVYEAEYGQFYRVFDGAVPSREAINSQVRRVQAMLTGS